MTLWLDSDLVRQDNWSREGYLKLLCNIAPRPTPARGFHNLVHTGNASPSLLPTRSCERTPQLYARMRAPEQPKPPVSLHKPGMPGERLAEKMRLGRPVKLLDKDKREQERAERARWRLEQSQRFAAGIQRQADRAAENRTKLNEAFGDWEPDPGFR